MYKKSFSLLIILISIALGGIIFMQLYWVQNALELKEEQFSHGIRIGLKSVVNRLLRDSSPEQPSTCTALQSFVTDSIMFLEVVPKEMLETYLFEEMKELGVMGDITYGIYHSDRKDMVFCSNAGMEDLITSSPHLVSLSCLISDDPYFLAIHIPSQKSLILKQMTGWLTLSFLFLAAVVFGFVYIINGWMRQKKLSEMKNDFINNMTHELQTPIATISISSEMLLKPEVRELPGRTEKYARIIQDENKRLQELVEQVMQAAMLDQGNYKLSPEPVDVHEILLELQKAFGIKAAQRQGQVKACLEAKNTVIQADRIHFTNIIANLIDNALKYSSTAPDITLTTADFKEGVLVSVKDRGIGISHNNLENIFKKLYRVPTGKVHNVKGFGLGLFYVKRLVDLHHGQIWVESEPGKGSRFFVYWPHEMNEG